MTFSNPVPPAFQLRPLDLQARDRLLVLAKGAIDVQNACNMSGVASSFAATVLEVRRVGEMLNCLSTEWVSNHPIVRAWVDKLASLSGIQAFGHDTAINAHIWCNDVVAGKQDPFNVAGPKPEPIGRPIGNHERRGLRDPRNEPPP